MSILVKNGIFFWRENSNGVEISPKKKFHFLKKYTFTDEYGDPVLHPSLGGSIDSTNAELAEDDANKPSITELMKNPSKVVLCKVSQKKYVKIIVMGQTMFEVRCLIVQSQKLGVRVRLQIDEYV